MSSSDHTEESDLPGIGNNSFKVTISKDNWQNQNILEVKEFSFELPENVTKYLEFILKKEVNPPIKGKITNNKIKYRGLSVCMVHNNDSTNTLWVEQRGVRVGPIITI